LKTWKPFGASPVSTEASGTSLGRGRFQLPAAKAAGAVTRTTAAAAATTSRIVGAPAWPIPPQPTGARVQLAAKAETSTCVPQSLLATVSVPETRAAVFAWACRLMETEGGSA
jgi:hypothetical protein